jgi:hypothetical protein
MPLYSNERSQVPDILYRGQQEFTRMEEEAKKLNQQAKAADAMVTANPEILSQLQLSAEQWKAGGARDRVAALQGIMQAQGYQKAQSEMKTAQLQRSLAQAQVDKFSRMETEDEAIGSALQRLYPAGSSPTAAAGPQPQPQPSILELLSANGMAPQSAPPQAQGMVPSQIDIGRALNTEGLGGRGALNLLAQLEKIGMLQQKSRIPEPSFVEDKETGNRFLQLDKTVLPSGINPARITAGAIPQVDEATGNIIGHSVPIGGGRYTFRGIANEATTRKADIGSITEAEKALANIDNEIAAYHRRGELAKTDKTVTAPPPSRLQELEQRKARVQRRLADLDEPPQDPAKPADRVTVVGPDGKQYTVPRSQLSQAQKQGYKPL